MEFWSTGVLEMTTKSATHDTQLDAVLSSLINPESDSATFQIPNSSLFPTSKFESRFSAFAMRHAQCPMRSALCFSFANFESTELVAGRIRTSDFRSRSSDLPIRNPQSAIRNHPVILQRQTNRYTHLLSKPIPATQLVSGL